MDACQAKTNTIGSLMQPPAVLTFEQLEHATLTKVLSKFCTVKGWHMRISPFPSENMQAFVLVQEFWFLSFSD